MINRLKNLSTSWNFLMMSYVVSTLFPFWQKKWTSTGAWIWVLLIYCWLSANFIFPQILWSIRNKCSEVLENIFFCFSAFDWSQSTVEVFSNNSLEKLNLQSRPSVMLRNVKGYSSQNSILADTELKYNTKV